MRLPPPVSSEAYSAAVGSEVRSNYLYTGFTINTGYNDNVLTGSSVHPVADVSYSIWPTIALDKVTPRLHQTLTYSPGFTFYQRTTALNETDQNLSFDLQYRLSPHITANLRDTFRKSSNIFNQSSPLLGGALSGSAQTSIVPIVAPYANQLNNIATPEVTYQFSRNGVVGGSGEFTNIHYSDPSEARGLANSASAGGGGFYSYRLSRTEYIGLSYQYTKTLDTIPAASGVAQSEANSQTQTHAALLFFTIYLKPSWSLSLSGGPLHYDVSQAPFPTIRSWSPAATASMEWKGNRTSFALNYSHATGGGGGQLGAFNSNSANALARWQLTRTWIIGSGAGYGITKNVSPFMASVYPGGHSLTETIMVQRLISEHIRMECGYSHIHQSYGSATVVSNAPDANREYISFSYQFTRPLGR
jgi:hypothetical protein